jgi:hypothetical protein
LPRAIRLNLLEFRRALSVEGALAEPGLWAFRRPLATRKVSFE